MRKLLTQLYGRFYRQHRFNEPLFAWAGLLGALAFPAFYLFRLIGTLPARHDDLPARTVATVLCIGLALRRWWPQNTRAHYLAFSYVCATYCLAFFLAFTLLQNHASGNTVVNVVVGATLVILLTDWRNTLLMLSTGYAASLAVYWAVDPSPRLPAEFIFWWAPLCGVLVVAGILFRLGDRRTELERTRLVYIGLAGSIAHEMRTPFHQIRQSVDNLAGCLTGAPLPEPLAVAVGRATSDMEAAASRGLQAIALVLHQLSPEPGRNKAGGYQSAAGCVRRAVGEYAYQSDAERRAVSVADGADFMLRGEEAAVLMVVFNVLRQLLNDLPRHPDLAVTLALGTNRIVVRGNGPRIAAGTIAGMFGEPADSGLPGGSMAIELGLAFCRHAMREMGGDINCVSTAVLTEFTLSFPAVSSSGVKAWEEGVFERARALLHGKRVLVVDDDVLVLRSMRANFEFFGAAVDEARNGAEALEQCRRNEYGLVLMDIEMPVLNGYEATEQLRRGGMGWSSHTPVLGHSVLPAALVRSKTRLAGMDGFLPKPCSLVELAQAFSPLLSRPDGHSAG